MEYKNWLAQKFKEIFDVFVARRDKYNGNSSDDFLQIRHAADQTGITCGDAIRFMMNMKMSRINWGAEADDDSMDDSVRDLVGYSMLLLRFRESQEKIHVFTSAPPLNIGPSKEGPEGSFLGTFKNFLGVGQ